MSGLRSNDRFYHLDMIFKRIDPNLIVNTRDLSNCQKDNLKFKILQAIVFDDLEKEK